MKKIYPLYYKNFACIADKCPDTCCAGWEIVVDSESLNRYRNLSGSFADKINSLISTDEDGDRIFTPCENRCPFLLENGLCEMYIKLGHDSLCRTCRLFPRHTVSFGARSETGLSLSCPEAARIIMESSAPITFYTEETDESIQPTDIDAELYFTLLQARKKAIDILQNRKFSIEHRICLFLEFIQALNPPIKNYDYETAKEITSKDFVSTKNHSAPRAKRALSKYFSDFKNLEMLDKSWKETLELAESADLSNFFRKIRDFEWEYEHLMVYFVFRYFMTAVFDRDVLTKAKFAAVSFIIIGSIHSVSDYSKKEIRTQIMQKYSKEVEHSANNLDFLVSAMKKSRFYSIENLTNILLGKENTL